MIVIDTHIWIWWVHDHPDLQPWMRQYLRQHETDGIRVSAISCWEIARSVAINRLDLFRPVAEWFTIALSYPGVELVDLLTADARVLSYPNVRLARPSP